MTGLPDYNPMPVLFDLPAGQRGNPRDQCVDYGASAYSLAITSLGYVRAFSLFCGRIADPRIAYAAGFSRGYSRCVEENLGSNILFMPVNFLAGKYRALGQTLKFIGKSEMIYSLLAEGPDRSSPRAAGDQAGYKFCQALELGREFAGGGRAPKAPEPYEPPVPSSLPEKQFFKPHVRGNLGERLAAESLAAVGYRIVYFKPDIKGTTEPGFDIIAIKGGKLYFFDNKAFARRGGPVTLQSVSALDANFDKNLRKFRSDLGVWIQQSPPQAQKVFLEARQILANTATQQLIDSGAVKRVVTNAGVILEPGRFGVSSIDPRLAAKKIEFLDIASLRPNACIPPDLQGVVTPPCDLDFVTKEGAIVPQVTFR
jgi:hypothetical protein